MRKSIERRKNNTSVSHFETMESSTFWLHLSWKYLAWITMIVMIRDRIWYAFMSLVLSCDSGKAWGEAENLEIDLLL